MVRVGERKRIIKIYFMKTIFKVVQVRESKKKKYSALCLNLNLDTFVTEFLPHLEKKREAGV